MYQSIETPMITMLRIASVKARTGDSKSKIYLDISKGLFPPPIRRGPRSSRWIEYEVEAVNRARAAGASELQIREFVKLLVAKRASLVNGFMDTA